MATNGVIENEQGLASGLVNTSFQFGAGLGLSAVGALSVLSLGDSSIETRLEALRIAMFVPVAAAAIAAFVMMTAKKERADA